MGWATVRGRFWPVTAVAAPIIVSIAALIVAVLSFQDQHSADVAAATANEQADANLVSYWAPNSNAIVVQNLGQDPVYDVTLTFGEFATTANAPVQEITNDDYSARVGTLPPCKVATINTKMLLTTSAEELQSQDAKVVETKAGAAGQADQTQAASVQVRQQVQALATTLQQAAPASSSLVTQISFQDPHGLVWTRSITGTLTEARPNVLIILPFETLQTQPAEGCS
jgi:uncharacterized protein with NAD-binding domain and iron-sulfur cluster